METIKKNRKIKKRRHHSNDSYNKDFLEVTKVRRISCTF
jgi:hypothetical protein